MDGKGKDTIYGGKGNDTLNGNDGNDVIYSCDDDVTLTGSGAVIDCNE